MNQLGLIQSIVARNQKPLKVLAAGVNTELRRLLVKRKGYNWLMSFSIHPVEKVVDRENLVFITDSAEEVLQQFDPT